jgi:hypothetical protein
MPMTETKQIFDKMSIRMQAATTQGEVSTALHDTICEMLELLQRMEYAMNTNKKIKERFDSLG